MNEKFTFRPRVKPGFSASIANAVNALLAGAFGSEFVRANKKNQLATPKNSNCIIYLEQ
jgi:hypothetical protein